MKKIILFGISAIQVTESEYSSQPENRFIYTDTLGEALDQLNDGNADILLVSREDSGITSVELSRFREQAGDKLFFIIRPPDKEMSYLLSSFLTPGSVDAKKERSYKCDHSEEESLIRKNQELTVRITALEAVVRSLLTALSQYDLSYKVYTGEEDAWKLIIQGMPAAELSPDEFSDEDEDDNPDEDYNESTGN